MVTSFGYVTAGSQTWRPHVTADVRLVEVGTGNLLMENRIVFNSLGGQDGAITLTPDGEYGFEDREDMVENPERLAEGLDMALRSTVDAAINLLR
ncbi:hypothetical protein ACI5KX_10525 [Erythrobacter sp. GH1-10]|uniref:hypothetical protein n=1 Tax=Erythrobacter sp. GH1-10 TaxID=3349334 RepID=UPI0038783D7C